MSDVATSNPHYKNPPIIEAVLDIDCDMPPGLDITVLERPVHDQLHDQYPTVRRLLVQTQQIQPQKDKPPVLTVSQAVQALQFRSKDEKQIVQFRLQGYSFNRLAPYTNLDDYLPEIARTWKTFIAIATPVQMRAVRLRYINRIMIPMTESRLDLEDYLKIGPRLPDEKRLTFTGFLDQHSAVETATGNQVSSVLTTLIPVNGLLPLIFDITVESPGAAEVEKWDWLLARIQSLRDLKNLVFRNTLTERCQNLFQQP
jgi:uncharacterized protein (TIGR04255 family)